MGTVILIFQMRVLSTERFINFPKVTQIKEWQSEYLNMEAWLWSPALKAYIAVGNKIALFLSVLLLSQV